MWHARVQDRDPGLQPERTRLAWRRTSLALAVATLAIGRITFGTIGAPTLIPALLVGAGVLWVLVTVRRRGRGVTHPDEAGFTTMLPDGRVPLAISLIVGVLCVGELLGIVVQATR